MILLDYSQQELIGFFPDQKPYKVRQLYKWLTKGVDFEGMTDIDKAWREKLSAFMGKGAKAMIELDKKERKYDRAKHAERLKNIIGNKDKILKIVKEELPDSAYILSLLNKIGAPVCCEDIGIEKAVLPTVFAAAKDIRDKYILPRLCWDLGVIDDIRF